MPPTGPINRQDYSLPLSQNDWLPGNLFSARREHGEFTIVKILAVDPRGVHVRIYKEHFASRPIHVEPASLTLGAIHDKDGFGFGHLPILREVFGSWEPVFLRSEPLTEEELEGYRIWVENYGGYFGDS